MIHYIFFVLAAIFIGTVGLFVNLSGNAVSPYVLGFYRVFFGFLIIAAVSPMLDKDTFKTKNKNLKINAFIGLLFAINFTGTAIAYLHASMQSVTLILATTPAFVLIFAYFLLGEKVTRTKIITLIFTLIGLLILNPIHPEGLTGNLIAMGVVISGGLMFTLMRKVNMKETIGNVFWFFLFASLFLLPMPIIFGFGTINLNIISLGIVSTGAAYLFYNLGYEGVEAEIGTLITNMITPLSGIIFAIFILGERINIKVLTGGFVLIIAAVYLRTHLTTRHKQPHLRHG
ncbi:MAG: DMT family transporter [Candidatus Woesearchaeota archaeon]